MDIQITWDLLNGYGDWSFANGDLVTSNGIGDLQNAVTLSLFTDRRCANDFVPWDGNRRGWWGDTYLDTPLGSRLWQLERAKKVGNTNLLLQARDYCKEALQWLVDDGIVATVGVSVNWISKDAIGIVVNVTEPVQRSNIVFSYSWCWV